MDPMRLTDKEIAEVKRKANVDKAKRAEKVRASRGKPKKPVNPWADRPTGGYSGPKFGRVTVSRRDEFDQGQS